ncbi:MAG: hypothetical protein ACRDHZ_07835 [Ktedonobacteraceae bacterium]
MATITYAPQYQPPNWHDNVDLVAAEGPRGFNAQFQGLQAELVALSGIVKQLNDAIVSANQTLQANNSAAQALQPVVSVVQAACWGHIKDNGSIAFGSGNFSVTKVSTGVYDIAFKSAFTSLPSVIVTQVFPDVDSINTVGNITSAGGSVLDNAVVVGIIKEQCRIKTGGGDGVAADRRFSFLAYGPTT